jgi:hypothetical protein
VTSERSETLQRVLESAARLQELVPEAVLVGGSAAALYAGHRESLDHDHVLTDLAERYAEVLDAVEASEGWATSVRASKPPMTILGSLDGIEAGLRQLRRSRPLETCIVEVGPGLELRVPTEEEALRIKAYLIVQRNAVRDYLDVVGLADRMGLDQAVQVLHGIDDYYVDRSQEFGSVLTQLVVALADPQPRDREVTAELQHYKGLLPRWQEWTTVVSACQDLADALVGELS